MSTLVAAALAVPPAMAASPVSARTCPSFLAVAAPYAAVRGHVTNLGRERGTDRFGAALAAGDLDGDGDGRGEIAVGAPGDGGLRYGSGVVTILDPLRRHAGMYTQESPDVKGAGEKWDAFGAAPAAGDFDADGRDDLTIGVPGEDADQVIAGTRKGGLTRRHDTLLKGLKGSGFGASVMVTGDRLPVGAPGAGELTLVAGRVRKGSYPGVVPGAARTVVRGGRSDLFGYTLG